MTNTSNKAIRYLTAAIFLAAIIAVIYYFPEIYRFFSNRHKLVRFLNSFGAFSPVVFISIQALQVVIALIPGELTGILGGFMYGKFWGSVYSTGGLTLGSILAFGLARIIGQPFVERVIPGEIIKKYDAHIRKKADFVYFYMFLIPGFPKDYLCYLLGLSPISFREFAIISTAGRLPGTIMLAVQGHYIRNGQYGSFFILLGISLVILALVYIYRDKVGEFISKNKA